MNRFVVFYLNRVVASYADVDNAIRCAKKMHNSYTYVDVFDGYTGELVYTWIY